MKTRVAAPLLSWTAIVLTGCMVGPNYVKPSTPMAPAFKEEAPNLSQTNDGWKLAQPGDQTSRGNWWEIYGDPQLNALEAQIDSANQTLKIAEANYREARTAIRFNRSYEAPTIGTAPSISTVRDSANQPYFPSSQTNNGGGDFVLPVDLSWEIDLWGRVRRGVTAAKEQTQASAADMAAVQLSLQADLAYDYFELRSADAEKKLLDDTVRAYSRALELTNNRFEGGAAPKSDVAQARTQLEDAQVLDTDIMVERAEYEHAIAILIGKPPANFSLPSSPIDLDTPSIPAIPQVLPSELLERRPDIAASERRMAAANEQIGIAEAAYYPALNLAALAGFEGTSATNWLNWPSRFWAVGPSLSETIFDAGRRRATKESAVAAYDGNVATYRQTTLTAFQQVEDNLAVLRILAGESQQQHNATAAADETLRLFMNRYAGGVDTYLQVVTSQTTALSNERNDIDIRRRQLDASVLLIKALGGDWNVNKLPNV
ncbi:MAG TPA: efflux transporter outer membrane subunit [Acidobacteriaceae bacterium]|jgi:NodT family efflux transporter outer membrane factor (OMF) lipoprotein|nr:efflux transporter outer membrane subunit [Acidobacteriaceae bacterium]